MKFKKILSLGIVLGAVLSVGMVVSASAAKPSGLEYPSNEIEMKEYPLNETTINPNKGAAGTYTSTTDETLTGDISFVGIKNVDAGLVKVPTTGGIGFKVGNTACKIIIITSAGNGKDQFAGDANIFKEGDETPTTVTAGDNGIVDLAANTSYYITGKDENPAWIEEIEFTTAKPTLKIIIKGNAGATTAGEKVAFAVNETDSSYYAIPILKDEHATDSTSRAYLNITSGSLTKSTDKVFTELKIGDVYYDANYFGTGGNYFYAFKLENDAGTLSTHSANPPSFQEAIDNVTTSSEAQGALD